MLSTRTAIFAPVHAAAERLSEPVRTLEARLASLRADSKVAWAATDDRISHLCAPLHSKREQLRAEMIRATGQRSRDISSQMYALESRMLDISIDCRNEWANRYEWRVQSLEREIEQLRRRNQCEYVALENAAIAEAQAADNSE